MIDSKKLQKISIVFEETGTDQGRAFNVYMTGHMRNLDTVPEKDLGPAEFWAMKGLQAVVAMLKVAGVIKTVTPLNKGRGFTQ